MRSKRGYVSGVKGPVEPGKLCRTDPPNALADQSVGSVVAMPEVLTR